LCRWHRTLMRHILPAQPVTAASFGMLEAASSALLVAVAGFLDRSAACGLGAASGTIDLAPVAAAADDDLGSAAMTKEESARDFHWRFPACQCAIDREMSIVKYSPCTRAQHGVGHGIGVNFAGLAGVVLVLLGGPFLPHRERACHLRVAPFADERQASPMAGARQGGVSEGARRATGDTPPCRIIGDPAAPKPQSVSTTDHPSPGASPTLLRQLSAGFDRH
jgi:hypothetical protein